MFGVNRNQMNIQQILSAIKNPEELYKQMYENNPEFKKFIDDNKGLSVEQIAEKYGIPIK